MQKVARCINSTPMEVEEPISGKLARRWSGDHETYACLDGVVVRTNARAAAARREAGEDSSESRVLEGEELEGIQRVPEQSECWW